MRGRRWRRQGREMPLGGKQNPAIIHTQDRTNIHIHTHTQQHREDPGGRLGTPESATVGTLSYSAVDPHNAKWMMEFNEDIKRLQAMIRQYSTWSVTDTKVSSRCRNINGSGTDTEVLSRCCDLRGSDSETKVLNICCDKSDKPCAGICVTCIDNDEKSLNRRLAKCDKGGEERCLSDLPASEQSELKQGEVEAKLFNKSPRYTKSDETERRYFGGSSLLEQTELKASDGTTQATESKNVKRALSNQSSLCDSGFEESLGSDGLLKERSMEAFGAQGTIENLVLSSNGQEPFPGTKESLYLSSNSQEPPLGTKGNLYSSSIGHDTALAAPGSEEYCSMQSVASRDSGVYTTDDTNTDDPTHTQSDRSLLEELESVCASPDRSLGPCLMRNPGLETSKDHRVAMRGKYPDWYIRFSHGDSHTLPMGTLYQSMNQSLGNISSITVSSTVSGVAGSVLSFTGSTNDEIDYVGVDQPGQKIKNMQIRKALPSEDQAKVNAQQNEANDNLNEARELAHDFSRINVRLQRLRSDLESLSSEANESMEDFRCLECRASQLVSSAASSRVRLSQLYAMKVLEARLQEEWWAAFNPHTLPLHENYIV